MIKIDEIKVSGFSDEAASDFEEQLAFVKSLGIGYIETRGVDGKNITELTDDELKAAKEKLDRYGIQISSIGSPIGKIKITDDFAPHFEVFKRTVEIAKYLGTANIRMFSFYIPEGEKPENYTQEVMTRLSAFKEYAEKENVVLLHENEKGIYGDNADRCAEIMKNLYGEHFKAVFDFANFVQVDQDTLEAYRLLKPYIAYVHIKDAIGMQVVPAGLGEGHAEEILRDFIVNNGYRGFLSLEPHLADFAGFSKLENKNEEEKKSDNQKFMWKLAYTALKAVLYDIENEK